MNDLYFDRPLDVKAILKRAEEIWNDEYAMEYEGCTPEEIMEENGQNVPIGYAIREQFTEDDWEDYSYHDESFDEFLSQFLEDNAEEVNEYYRNIGMPAISNEVGTSNVAEETDDDTRMEQYSWLSKNYLALRKIAKTDDLFDNIYDEINDVCPYGTLDPKVLALALTKNAIPFRKN